MTNKSLGRVIAIVIVFVAIWIIAIIVGLVESKFRLISKPKYGKRFLKLTSFILYVLASLACFASMAYFTPKPFFNNIKYDWIWLIPYAILFICVLALTAKCKALFSQYYLKTPRKPLAAHLLSASALLAYFAGLMIGFKIAESNLLRLSIFGGYTSISFVLLRLIPSQKKVKKSEIGLEIFEEDLHPEVVAEIRGWIKHPELSKLLKRLESIRDWEQFLDCYAEAMVACHLISQECEIKVEVPTKNGKSADFKVSKGSNTFFVHVKRLNFDREMQHDLNVGNDPRVKDGGDEGRYLKKLKSAYKQFMPDGVNIILVTSAWREDFSIEDLREDMEDFWSNGKHSDSNIIGWFLSHPREKNIDFKLFFRENSEKPLYTVELFGRNSLKRKK